MGLKGANAVGPWESPEAGGLCVWSLLATCFSRRLHREVGVLHVAENVAMNSSVALPCQALTQAPLGPVLPLG